MRLLFLSSCLLLTTALACSDDTATTDTGSDASADGATMDSSRPDGSMDGAMDAIIDGAADSSAPDTTVDSASLMPTGTAGCTMDSECAEGVCWDYMDIDSFCGGTVCSLGCGTSAECITAATDAGASSPSAATCGTDGTCNFFGTGLGLFFCT